MRDTTSLRESRAGGLPRARKAGAIFCRRLARSNLNPRVYEREREGRGRTPPVTIITVDASQIHFWMSWRKALPGERPALPLYDVAFHRAERAEQLVLFSLGHVELVQGRDEVFHQGSEVG